MKIGLIRENRTMHDKRVALTPAQCVLVKQQYSGLDIVVQPSEWRAFSDEEYKEVGVELNEDLSNCDLLFGIKQVPVDRLIPNKQYLFFSHTIKKQPENKDLLSAILEKKIQLVDYECLTDAKGNRVLGFGYYAGLVGAYNAFMGYGKKYKLFDLKPAHLCYDKEELKKELRKIHLPNIKIIVTGNGRAANGAVELLGALGVRRITPFEFQQYTFLEATYAQLHSEDYNEAKDESLWNREHFYQKPEQYASTFNKYTKYCDLLIHCSFWNPKAPKLFSKGDMRQPDFRLGVIADVTCDINGSIPSTMKATTIDDKFYGYNPEKQSMQQPFVNKTITVMAVDNLPCELPRDASEAFGKDLMEKVLPSLLTEDKNGLIKRGTITHDGKLMPNFEYLSDYVKGD